MKKKGFFIGYLAENEDKFNGQTIRTRNVKRLLEEELGFSLSTYDTIKLRKNPFSIISVLLNIRKFDSIFVLLAHRGVRLLLPLICFLGWRAKKKVYFIAIGGWLPEFAKKYYWIRWAIKRTSILFVQSKLMANLLQNLVPHLNIEILPNFKFYDFNTSITKNESKNIKLVYISQVSLIKGIDTVEYLMRYCLQKSLPVTIDIYGPIKKEDEGYFISMLSQNSLIKYLGVLNDDRLFKTLATYDLMIFPTHHLTEGFPGVILDAFISGVPILASKWNYGSEFVKKDFGLLYRHDDKEEALKHLLFLIENREQLFKMKQAAYLNRDRYAVSQIAKHLTSVGL